LKLLVVPPGALVLGFATLVRFTLALGEGVALFGDKSRPSVEENHDGAVKRPLAARNLSGAHVDPSIVMVWQV
jgi:hypothetical protein